MHVWKTKMFEIKSHVDIKNCMFKFQVHVDMHSPVCGHTSNFASPPPPSFTQSPSPPRSLVRDGQTSPHRPRLVVSRSTCPPITPPPHANSFVLGPAVMNTHTPWGTIGRFASKLSGSRIECCQARCGCRGYRVPSLATSFVVRGLDDELAPVLHALSLFLGYSVSSGST